MRSFIIVLLVSTLAVASSNKNHQARRQLDVDEEERSSEHREPEILEYPEIDEFYYSQNINCPSMIADCWDEFRRPYILRENGVRRIFNLIKESGSTEVCRQLLDAKECVASKIRDPKCQSHSEITSISDSVKDSAALIDYLCEQRIDDAAKHWNCILDSESVSGLLECSRSPYLSCEKIKPAVECFQQAINSSSVCQPGASDLGGDILERYMSYISSCPEPDILKSMLKRMWMNM